MKGLRSFIFSEKRLAGAIFGILALAAFSFIFGPNIYAQFARQDGAAGWGYGYGYGYGYGSGSDKGANGYRTTGNDLTTDNYGYGYGYMGSDVTYNATTGYSVTPSDLASLVASGIIVPNGGSTAATFDNKVTLTVGTATVTIPSGTTFTAGSVGNFSALAASASVDTSDLSGATVAGALSFGLPNMGLTVNPAITIAVNVGSTYEGQVLYIFRKDAGGSWVFESNGTTPSCTVTAGICTFTTTHLSSFALAGSTAGGGANGKGAVNGTGGGASTYTPSIPASTDSTVTGNYDVNTAKINNPDINTDMGLLSATATPACVSGTLIKSASLPAVYYCGKDGKRYVFVNDKAYFSWYADFSGVQIVSDTTLATIALGGNITYRPGVRMVKVMSDPKVYAVARGGVLRWVGSEAIATRLYGANWNQQIDDIADSFFVNYHVGASITQ